MSSMGSVTLCVQHLRSPDCRERDEAARVIWERFSAAAAGLVRRHLDNRIRRREDEQDILQSVYASFCLGQLEGKPRRRAARSCGSSWSGSRCARSSTRPTGIWRPAATSAASAPRLATVTGVAFSPLDARARRPGPAQPGREGHRSRRGRAAPRRLFRPTSAASSSGSSRASPMPRSPRMIGRTVRSVELKMQIIRKRIAHGPEPTGRSRECHPIPAKAGSSGPVPWVVVRTA